MSEVVHYGIKRRSGRYPWGSGGNVSTPYLRAVKFQTLVSDIKAAVPGIKEKDILVALGLDELKDPIFTINDLRSTTTIAKDIVIREEAHRAVMLRDKGMSPKAISEKLGLPLGTVRLRLKQYETHKESVLTATSNVIREAVDKYSIVDVGKGTNFHLDGVSPEKVKAAVSLLVEEGYEPYTLKIRNVGTKNQTSYSVLTKPGTTFGEASKMRDNIHVMANWSEDGGLTHYGIKEPLSVDPKRLKVNYAEDGGGLEDGVVYVRRGVKDLSMGKSQYAQVRIKIGETHYIKGMAIVTDNLPEGVDLLLNTPKKRGTPLMGDKTNSVLKPLKDDPENPFGSMIQRQIIETNPKTGEDEVVSAVNIVNEEGSWDDWRKSLPSQMLAKQPNALIRDQLEVTRHGTLNKLDEINSITNPIVKKDALAKFADQIDSDAVELRAAAMPKQHTQVILPLKDMPKNEVYAPNFETGTRVVLIRFPHGGPFEIPELIVNNNRRKAKAIIANAPDAIGIHPSVAERLSGADFDGDTVLAIRNDDRRIKGFDSLGQHGNVYDKALKNFDPKTTYGGYEVIGKNAKGEDVGNFPLMKDTGLEMGRITNLITDMQVLGATPEHVVRAVKHSMVVIDAEKHMLDYKASERDNNIAQLKELYQGSSNAGAQTILARSTAEVPVPEIRLRKMSEGGPVDPTTGELRWVETGAVRAKYDSKTKTYMDGKDGRPLVNEPKTTKMKRMSLTNDANTLVSDPNNQVERLYADHVNAMKTYANQARLQSIKIADPRRNKEAASVYATEVEELRVQINQAKATKPLERKANIIAQRVYKERLAEDPTLRFDADRRKKIERQVREGARIRMGLKRPVITPTDRQWDAIQAGALSSSMTRDMLEYADEKRINQLASPRTNTVLTSAVSSRAKSLLASGKTWGEISDLLGVSVATLKSANQRGDL